MIFPEQGRADRTADPFKLAGLPAIHPNRQIARPQAGS